MPQMAKQDSLLWWLKTKHLRPAERIRPNQEEKMNQDTLTRRMDKVAEVTLECNELLLSFKTSVAKLEASASALRDAAELLAEYVELQTFDARNSDAKHGNPIPDETT